MYQETLKGTLMFPSFLLLLFKAKLIYLYQNYIATHLTKATLGATKQDKTKKI